MKLCYYYRLKGKTKENNIRWKIKNYTYKKYKDYRINYPNNARQMISIVEGEDVR